jgi:sirohydrochlorin cobaltochelatase
MSHHSHSAPAPDHPEDHDHHHDHHHHQHGPEAPCGPKHPGILLAAFGTAVGQAREAYAHFEEQVRLHHPGIPVAWGFTAHKVRRKLASRGLPHDGVATALSRMHDDGVTHLAVQSLHTVPGVEFFWTRDLARAYEHPRKGFHQVRMGKSLLHDTHDLDQAAACLPALAGSRRQPGQALVLVGHGTYHHGQHRYLDFQTRIQDQDELVFVGLLMGQPDLTSIITRLRQSKISTVHLQPFMAVCGHHVRQDMFGSSPHSWSSQLRAAGFQVHEHLVGTLEIPCCQSIWLDHLGTALAGLNLDESSS